MKSLLYILLFIVSIHMNSYCQCDFIEHENYENAATIIEDSDMDLEIRTNVVKKDNNYVFVLYTKATENHTFGHQAIFEFNNGSRMLFYMGDGENKDGITKKYISINAEEYHFFKFLAITKITFQTFSVGPINPYIFKTRLDCFDNYQKR